MRVAVLTLAFAAHGFAFAPSRLVHRAHTARLAALADAPVNPRSEGLALQLDDGTRKSHSVAESTAFVTGFFKGLATEKSFARLLCGLYVVYDAMEEALDARLCDATDALDFPELRRRASLEADMAFFFGPNWRESPDARPSPAARKYAKRVREVAAGDTPELLLGHLCKTRALSCTDLV